VAEEPGKVLSGGAAVNMLLAGYAHALHGLKEAIEAEDPDATFRAVFASLNWPDPQQWSIRPASLRPGANKR
jgi:hypothetical protein